MSEMKQGTSMQTRRGFIAGTTAALATPTILRAHYDPQNRRIMFEDYGAAGDGTLHDTEAILRTLRDAPNTHRVAFWCPNYYRCEAMMDFSRFRWFGIDGGGHGRFIGRTPGEPLVYLYRSANGSFIRGLEIRQDSPDGYAALVAEGSVGFSLANSRIRSRGKYGAVLARRMFSSRIESVDFDSLPGYEYSTGLVVGDHSTVDTCDFAHWGVGLQSFGLQCKVEGLRQENCYIGTVLGRNLNAEWDFSGDEWWTKLREMGGWRGAWSQHLRVKGRFEHAGIWVRQIGGRRPWERGESVFKDAYSQNHLEDGADWIVDPRNEVPRFEHTNYVPA